jgi:hypothetical protein
VGGTHVGAAKVFQLEVGIGRIVHVEQTLGGDAASYAN